MNVPDAISDLWHGMLDYYMRLFYLLPQELTYKEKLLLLNNSLKITFVRLDHCACKKIIFLRQIHC